MPNINRITSPFIGGTGNPDTAYQLISTTPGAYSPYAPGDLGNVFDTVDKTYRICALDSGATSATPAGAVAANQLAYWKDKANFVVTNDSRFGLLGGVAASQRNNVAGLFRAAVPAGAQFFLLVKGRSVLVKEVGSAAGGMTLCASTSTTAADALGTAIATASPVEQIGVVTVATTGGNCTANFEIPNV